MVLKDDFIVLQALEAYKAEHCSNFKPTFASDVPVTSELAVLPQNVGERAGVVHISLDR